MSQSVLVNIQVLLKVRNIMFMLKTVSDLVSEVFEIFELYDPVMIRINVSSISQR